MPRTGFARWRGPIATVALLAPLMAYVVWSSLHVSAFECSVCMRFEGREVCRTVTGQTEEEGVRSGMDNACALLTSGVTNTLRCTGQRPASASCRPL